MERWEETEVEEEDDANGQGLNFEKPAQRVTKGGRSGQKSLWAEKQFAKQSPFRLLGQGDLPGSNKLGLKRSVLQNNILEKLGLSREIIPARNWDAFREGKEESEGDEEMREQSLVYGAMMIRR